MLGQSKIWNKTGNEIVFSLIVFPKCFVLIKTLVEKIKPMLTEMYEFGERD